MISYTCVVYFLQWEFRGKAGNLKCTKKDIDQVIGEWASHVMGFGEGHPMQTLSSKRVCKISVGWASRN